MAVTEGPIAAITDMPDVLVIGDHTRITVVLHAEDDETEPVDLGGIEDLRLILRRELDREMLLYKSGSATLAASGEAEAWIDGDDLVHPGDYVYEWQVGWGDGAASTSQLGTVLVRRR